MRSFSKICSPTFVPLPRDTCFTTSTSRTQIAFTRKIFCCRAKFAESEVNGSLSLKAISQTLLAAEKEEAKAVLTLFLKKQGLSNATAARTINKSDSFIDHLVSRLHLVHKSRYLVGRELTTLEIREALIPYLETLLEEHQDLLVEMVESFPNPPVKMSPPVSPPVTIPVPDAAPTPSDKKLKAVPLVETELDSNLSPSIIYLEELGLNLDQIKGIIRRFPSFANYSLERKIKPLVDFLLELGVPKKDIPVILHKRPQLCGISLNDNLIPTMSFLEGLGVDKTQWVKVIHRFPAILTYSRKKITASVNFLRSIGLSEESIGKILTRWPNITSYSVEENLLPTADYFRSLGVDVSVLILRAPQAFGLSIEANLMPMTEFFTDKGYSREEIGTMISRYGALYTFSLTDNLVPKWEFFVTMDYPKSEIVKFPQYFGYSLEERIKPRYAIMKECGVSMLLNQLLSLSGPKFEKALKTKMDKL